MSSFTGARSKANANSEMTKANEINLCPVNTSTITSTSPDTSAKNDKKKKVFIFYCYYWFLISSVHYIFLVFKCNGDDTFSFTRFFLWWSLSFQRFSDQSEMGEVQTKRHSNHQVQKKETELLLVFNSWHFFFLYIENLNFHVVRFPLILFYKCFVWKDLENKIETRRKAFLEAAPIMRKSFSGTQMHTFSCDTNTIFTFSEIESTHLIALITIFLQYNIINNNTYIQNYGFSLHWKYGGSTLDFGSNLYSSAYLSNKTKSSSCYHVLFW